MKKYLYDYRIEVSKQFPSATPLPDDIPEKMALNWFNFLETGSHVVASDLIGQFVELKLPIPHELGGWVSKARECWLNKHKKAIKRIRTEKDLELKLFIMALTAKRLGIPVDDAADYTVKVTEGFDMGSIHSKETLKEYYRKSRGKEMRAFAEKLQNGGYIPQEDVEIAKQKVWDYLLDEDVK